LTWGPLTWRRPGSVQFVS